MKYNILIVFLIFLGIVSCNDTQELGDHCYSFQERSCLMDHFHKEEPSDKVPTVDKIKKWLDAQSIPCVKVIEKRMEGAVCLACDVCPSGRYYLISTEVPIDSLRAVELHLLNLQSIDCAELN